MRVLPGLICTCLFSLACDLQAPDGAPDGAASCNGKCDAVEGGDEAPTPPSFQVCDQQPAPAAEPTGVFRHFSSDVASFGTPMHSAVDAIATPGGSLTIEGKFAYGLVDKDLEDEEVEVWLDDCEGLTALGKAMTDGDGRIHFEADPSQVSVGRHAVHLRVVGDGTVTSGTVWVVPEKTRVAVFDIDGTLTTSDWELLENLVNDLFMPIFEGNAPEARAAADKITQARFDQGYVIVYLTGRPYWLTARSREWLRDRGMAPGLLHLAAEEKDALPATFGVGAYKADYLAKLQLAGLQVDMGYGNATTDIFAYDDAGLPKDQTFIVGRHGGTEDTVGLGDDFEKHVETLDAEPIEQPFTR